MEEYNIIINQEKARQKIKEGVNLAVDLISPTLGHSSRKVLIDKQYGDIVSSDDGTSILNEINVEDPQVQLGVKVVKETSAETNSKEGDGTTSTGVILRELINGIIKDKDDTIEFVKTSGNNLKLKKEINEGAEKVLKYIDENKLEVTDKDIEFVGRVSSNDEKIGKILSEIFTKLGKDGAVSVEESKGTETTYKITEGLSIDQGWLARQFETDQERQEAVLEDGVNILVSSKKLQDVEDIQKIAELGQNGLNNFLIIADDVSGIVLKSLIFNKMSGAVRCVAIKAPQLGNSKELLKDICIATGAQLVGDDIKISDLTTEHFGKAERVVVDKDKTVIIGFGGKKEEIETRIKQLEKEKKNQDSEYEKNKLTERISKLKNGVGSIKVGGDTPMEIKDKKAKIDDAVSAVRSALRGGIVPGGGVMLMLASQKLDSKIRGELILGNAIQKPFHLILENADVDPNKYSKEVLASGKGYNVETEEFDDMIKMGIMDPANVVKSSVKNAVSTALQIASIGGSINLVRKKKEDKEEE